MHVTDSEKTDPLTGAPHDGRTKDLESALVGSEVHIGCDESPFERRRPRRCATARGPQRALLDPRTFHQAADSATWGLSFFTALVAGLALVVHLPFFLAEDVTLADFPMVLATPTILAIMAMASAAWSYHKHPEVLHDARRDYIWVWLTNEDAANVASAALKYDNEAALQALRVLEKGDATSLEARQLAASALLRLHDKHLKQKAEQDAIEAAKAAEIQRLDEETNLLKGLPDELDMHELHVRLELNDN